MMGVQREMPGQKHVFQRSVYFGHNDNTYVYYIIEMRPSCTLRCTAAAIPTWRPNYPHYYAAIQHYLSNWPKHTKSKYSRNRTGPIFCSGDCGTFCPIFDVIWQICPHFPDIIAFLCVHWNLFENLIELHRIWNWLKSLRPAGVGESRAYDWSTVRQPFFAAELSLQNAKCKCPLLSIFGFSPTCQF